MKKLLLSSLAVAALSLASMSASALVTLSTVNGAFDVTANLTPKCLATTVTKPVMTFNYTAFQTLDLDANTISLAFKCTKGVSIVSALITNNDATTNKLLGLAYTLTVSAPTTGTLASTGPAAADTYSYSIAGKMVLGQAGDMSSGVTATASDRVLVISY